MKSVLVLEASPTRRRALTSLLQQRGWETIAPDSAEAGCEILRHATARGTPINAAVFGWPERQNAHDQEFRELLRGDELLHIPVVLFSDESTDVISQWRMTRPRTSLLTWSEYSQVARQIDQAGSQQIFAATSLAPLKVAQRVLLVDDSPTVRAGYRRLMQKHGYEVETADSVDAGLELALRQPFDLAVIDYFMPDQNGTALIAAMQEHPQTRHILAAIITGTYSDEVIVESLASGAVECLFKSESKDLFVVRLASMARTRQDRKAVDAERRRLEGILSAVGDGVFGVEPDGTILFVNPAALRLLGFQDARDLVGHRAGEIIHPGPSGEWNPDQPGELDKTYLDGASLPNWQSIFWSAARLPIPVEGTVYPLHLDGVRQGSVVAFRDVSAQRKLEEQLRWQAEHDSLTGLHNRAWFEPPPKRREPVPVWRRQAEW